ncbi:N-acetyltransferase [Streptococcus chenjunshii]|uniref:N-acetyltransferase n=2 Tax=Streptococcus chenjunshii TaxID=2173853 RepID=A0A372KMF2_9STRE|nr:N-acetyltransferase [Streptococcus chenjunshii]RFU50690.1 N-acetyltransferase [Streptococcus chenjunshii]RFU53462.1 N-acetyltransferase [Streptococcus chenjunshii]
MMKIIGTFENNQLPVIETDRLCLRQRTAADAGDIFAYASLPEVTWPAGFPPVQTVEEEVFYLEEIYPQNLQKEDLPSGYGITIKGQNKVIGSLDFNHRHADDVLEIGYTLHSDYWGRGYMPEAVRALLEVGFTLLKLHKIELVCYDYNKQSRRIAEKLGFTLEARIRGRKDAQGRRCASLTYGLLKSEWEERK